MAFGSWLAGALYDHFGFYAPAFAVGVFFNLANLVVIGFLVARQGGRQRLAAPTASALDRRLRPRCPKGRRFQRYAWVSSAASPRLQTRSPFAAPLHSTAKSSFC